MIYHKCEPRSALWFFLRVGKPTSSEFHRILTPTGKLSAQSTDYAHSILAEMMLGKPLDEDPASQWMIRGQELEDAAIEAYEFESGLETSLGGFCTDDSETIGCSPDRLVGEDGVLEMKCPAPNTHIGYLLDRAAIEKAKWVQVQGQLLVTGRQWVDLVAFHPELPLLIRRVKRDEKYIKILGESLAAFVKLLTTLRLDLERQYGPFPEIKIPQPEEKPADDGLGVSEEDVDAIWAASQAEVR